MAASYMVKGGTFVAEKPRAWITNVARPSWDLAPDGKRVVVATPVESAEAPKPEHEPHPQMNVPGYIGTEYGPAHYDDSYLVPTAGD